MNPLTQIKNTQKATLGEVARGISDSASWHARFKHSAYVYAGGLSYDLTEGDVLAVFSQYGEIVDVNLVRDRETGKSKGFAFVAFEDQRSTVLAVDNLSGARVVGRTVRVEHVDDYKLKRKEVEQQGGVLAGTDLEPGAAPAGAAAAAAERIAVPEGAVLDEDAGQYAWGGAPTAAHPGRDRPSDAGPAAMDDAAILAAVRARKAAAEAAAAMAAAGGQPGGPLLPPPPPPPARAVRDEEAHAAAKRARKEAKHLRKEAKHLSKDAGHRRRSRSRHGDDSSDSEQRVRGDHRRRDSRERHDRRRSRSHSRSRERTRR